MAVDKEGMYSVRYTQLGDEALSHTFDESAWCPEFLRVARELHIVSQVNDTLVQEPTEYGEAEVVEPKQLSE